MPSAVDFILFSSLSLLLDVVRDEGAPLWKGYLFAFSMFLLSCLQSIFNHQYMYSCFTVGMRVKTAIMGLVYRKVVSLKDEVGHYIHTQPSL